MIQTKYFCDKCKTEVKEDKDLTEVAVCLRDWRSSFSYWSEEKSLHLCVACQEKVGLIKRVLNGNAIKKEAQPIKDRLFDIFEELLSEAARRNMNI